MLLKGSCHCGAVTFTVRSHHLYPYNPCFCSICRKTAGAGGFAIVISAISDSMSIEGREHVREYRAKIRGEATGEITVSPGRRSFCDICGSALWVSHPHWPELVHPFASTIDTELPTPPERTHIMLGSRAPRVKVYADPQDRQFDGYPEESIAAWHQRLGLEDPE